VWAALLEAAAVVIRYVFVFNAAADDCSGFVYLERPYFAFSHDLLILPSEDLILHAAAFSLRGGDRTVSCCRLKFAAIRLGVLTFSWNFL
jgi:hypothetical protein